MLKSLIVALIAGSTLVAVTATANAAPKCKDGQIYSEEARKCINAPRGS